MKPRMRVRGLRRLLLGLLSCCCVVLFAACSLDKTTNQAETPPSSPASPGAPLVLKVAVDPAFPPFEMKAADGTLTGFDIDLINAIGGNAGFIIDFDEMSFTDLIRSLYAGKVNAAVSAITINRDRSEKVSFSRPYFKSGLAIATPAANTDITSLETLQGKRVGVQQGTTSELKAQVIPDVKVEPTASAPDALQALADGKVDAVINDAPVIAYTIKSGSISGLKMLEPLLTEEFYGIATPKDSPYLEKINAGLTAILSNGTYAQIYKKWFAMEPPQLPEATPL